MERLLDMRQGVTGHGVEHHEHHKPPTQIWKEESRKSFFTNDNFFFAGTKEGDVLYVLAKLIRVVLVSLILSPYRCNQYMAQLNTTQKRIIMKAYRWHAICVSNLKKATGKIWILTWYVHCFCFLLKIRYANNSKDHRQEGPSTTSLKYRMPGSIHHEMWSW